MCLVNHDLVILMFRSHWVVVVFTALLLLPSKLWRLVVWIGMSLARSNDEVVDFWKDLDISPIVHDDNIVVIVTVVFMN